MSSEFGTKKKKSSPKEVQNQINWKDDLLHFITSGESFPSEIGPIDCDMVPIFLMRLMCSSKDKKPIFFIAQDIGRAEQCREDFLSWCEIANISPRTIVLPDGSFSSQKLLTADSPRARALFRILDEKPDIVFASASGVLSDAPSPDYLIRTVIDLNVGKRLVMGDLLSRLVKMDYDDEEEVTVSGEFSHHGGIVDIFSASEDFPARIEFFGNSIESIRLFNPDTQMTIQHVHSYRVILRSGSAHELQQDDIVQAYTYPEQCDYRIVTEFSSAISAHLQHYGMPEDSAAWDDFLKRNVQSLVNLEDSAGASTNASTAFSCVSMGKDALADSLPPEQKKAFLTESTFSYLAQQVIAGRIRQWIDEKITITLLFPKTMEKERINEFLSEHSITEGPFLRVFYDTAPCGFFLLNERTVVLTLRELYNLPNKHRSSVSDELAEIMRQQDDSVLALHNMKAPIISAFDLNEDDYAVHINYGLCIYHGLAIQEAGDVTEEVIRLEFDDEVIVSVSVMQAHLITRYVGAKPGRMILSKISGTRWNTKKREAMEAVRSLAFDMLKIQAIREKSKGNAFPPDFPEQLLFEESFPFYETNDQIQAMKEIKRDMESDKPMDRLLCGDVGFGKTELAMRAACKCALSGQQVAILVPTTVLAQQHYMTFSERFAGTSVTIEQLSRFKTKQEQVEIIRRLKEGSIDIIIGTHRLAQKDIGFKNLGLLIIDEEQRFGVEHKEFLKRMRATVDVLTMTATPIPRTLHLSLSGIRDMSTLITAPVQRLPIRTVFAQYDLKLIKKAIEFELNRGGQVYYLHNRVKTIDQEAAIISALFPDVEVGIGHGRMDKEKLENVMQRFIEGNIKILVCTTIIESGIDIPNANTIIINRADTLGLAELYQLRGRVGRWVRQAYAYLFLPNPNLLTGNARKRIDAMRRYTHLGSGFQLAMSDLEIRGAGNILGSEQSGQINAIGFHLYCQLLNQSVQSLTGQISKYMKPCKLILDFLAYGIKSNDERIIACIPIDYVKSEKIRLHLYRRLGQICEDDGDFDIFATEMVDRFGPLPLAFSTLLMTYKIKYCGQKNNFDKIECIDNVLRIERNSRLLRMHDQRLPVLPSILKPQQKLKMILQIVQNARHDLI